MKKKLIKNMFSISGVQLANYVLPLVTVPYIVRVIGPGKYGLVNFAGAFIGYFSLVINYGFDLTATREIARKQHDIPALSKIFWNIITAKMFLFIVSTIAFAGTFLFLQKLQLDPRLYVLTYLCTIGMIFFPTWLFQGIEELATLAMFNLAIKIIFTISIFVLIQQQSDYYYYPVCISIGQVLVGLLALWYAIKRKHLSLPIITIRGVMNVLKEGALVFITTVVINIYTLSNTVLLGFMASDEEVGYFSSAYKLIAIIMALGITPITQTLYPHLGSVFSDISKNKEEKSYTLLRVALAMTGITLAISIATFVAAPIAVSLLFGKNFSPAITSLRLMSFLPLIIGLSNVFGIQGMLNLKLDKEFFGVTAVGAILCIALNIFLIPHYSQLGTTGSWVLTEIFITVATYAVLRYHGYTIFTKNNITRVFASRYV